MSRHGRARRWGLCATAAVAMAVLAPATPAAADTWTIGFDERSGHEVFGGVGDPDPETLVSTDGGATFRPAIIVAPADGWATLPVGQWISSDADRGISTAGSTTLFRISFRVPPGPLSSTATVCLHAADAAVVRLNGAQVGAQPTAPVEANAADPAECFALPVADLVGGDNVLEFAVANAAGDMGIQFRVTGSVVADRDAAPVLVLPDDVVVDSAGPEGAVVRYAAGAIYSLPSNWPLTPCTPPSGDLFPVGTTTVTCTAANPTSGASSTGTFQVTVRAPADTVPPVVDATASPPATSSGWHTTAPTVSFGATDGGSGIASITYASTGALSTPPTTVDGAVAALPIAVEGVTEVTYTAADTAGNVSPPQVVTVRYDGTAPVLTGVRDKRLKVVTAERVRAFYDYIGGVDGLGGPVEVACDPPSGSFFPLGVSTVTCTATDEAGNEAAGQFTVTIWREDPLVQLSDSVVDIAMPRWVRTSLAGDLSAAVGHFEAGRTWLGCRELRQMDQTVVDRRGDGLTWASATTLRALIADARSANGCS